jgi:hypothetical protein
MVSPSVPLFMSPNLQASFPTQPPALLLWGPRLPICTATTLDNGQNPLDWFPIPHMGSPLP